MVLRLRSSESVLERDEGEEEKSRIFTVHQDKHALLIKLPEMIAAYFWAKGNTLATLKLSNMSVYNILCCIRRQLFYERVVQQQWSWWNDWREDHDTKYRNSLVPSGLTWRNPNETIIEKSIRPNFSVSFAPEAKRGCKRKLFELMTYATLERFIRKGAVKMQISVRFTVFLFVAVDKFIFLIPTFLLITFYN